MPQDDPASPPRRSAIEQLIAAIGERLAAAQRWAKDHEAEIAAAVQGMIIWSRLHAKLQETAERYRGTEWDFLLDRVDFIAATALLLALERDGSEGVTEILERALGRPAALAPMLESLSAVPMPEPHRQQLTEGLRHVSRQDYVLAVPLLIGPFEGIVHGHARKLGLIEPHKGKKHRFAEQTGRKGTIGGIEDLLWFEDLGFDEPFAAFLKNHVYGGTGDPYRHGFATEGFRQRALMLTVGLLGWLDAVAAPSRRGEALRRVLFEVGTDAWDQLIGLAIPTGDPLLGTDQIRAQSRLLAPGPSA